MPRGKKFDAAQKYVEKRVKGYNRTIDGLRKELSDEKAFSSELDRRNKLLEQENAELSKQIEALKELHGLSDSDVKELVERSKSLNTTVNLFKTVCGSSSYRGVGYI